MNIEPGKIKVKVYSDSASPTNNSSATSKWLFLKNSVTSFLISSMFFRSTVETF